MTHSRLGVACAFTLLCVLGCSLPAAADAADLIVRREAGLSATERADVRAGAGVRFERKLVLPDTEVVTVPGGREARALADLRADPDVRFAVPDVMLHIAAASDLQGLQWALENGGPWSLFPRAIADSDIDATDAWQTSQGQNVTVGVVDQSVDAGHPDLLGNVAPGKDFTQPDGCTAGVPAGGDDHGTQMAGLIAARHDGEGITGVAPQARVLPLRAMTDCGDGKLAWALNAFAYAGEAGVPIVSASFSSDPNVVDPGYNAAFLDVFDTYQDTLFVVAAGNEGDDVDDGTHPVYPCATKRPAANPNVDNLLCVGATDNRDEAACWSNVGAASVDLFAPGVSILSTARENGYATRSGTSQATAMVAAAAAVLRADDTMLRPLQLAQALIDSVDVKAPLVPWSVAGGRLNVARALHPSGRYGSGGGESVAWRTCDRDHDGVRDDGGQDKCPDQPGTEALGGCPDADRDGLVDPADNCATVANADQADADGDRVGDVCDPTPRGDDADGDAKPFLDDRCPNVAGNGPDGCPSVITPPNKPVPPPTVTPQSGPAPVIVYLKAKLSRCPKGKVCTKVAKVTVKLSRQAKVKLKVERRVRKKGRLVWTRVRSLSLTANARGRTLTVRGRRGKPTSRYRVTATLSGKAKSVSFRV